MWLVSVPIYMMMTMLAMRANICDDNDTSMAATRAKICDSGAKSNAGRQDKCSQIRSCVSVWTTTKGGKLK